nr:uncharacterized protein LOC112757139 [Arachis hypogaea]
MVTNNQYFFAHQRQCQPSQKKGVLELEGVDTILEKNKLMHQQIQQQMEMMAKRIDSLQIASVNTTNQPSNEWGQNEASHVEQQQEQVQYIQNASNSSQNDFHGDTYNSSWRNHPNLRWGQERYEVTMKNLERQVGQLAKQDERPTNVLPNDTIPNPSKECKALQLRSGKVIGESSNKEATKLKEQDTVDTQDEEKASTLQKSKEDENPQSKTHTQDSHPNNKDDVKPQQESKNERVKAYVPKLPYPTRVHKGTKDQQFPRFLEIFKKLEINIPLTEALEQMPLYAKFLKELITKKRSWQEKETVILTQECSAIIQRGLPPKLKDPGSFLIPCTIGNIAIDKSLCDLGASINLMPLTMLKKMMIEELKPTRMSLQLADRSIKIPNGIVENLLVKVGNFIFPVDFVVLDMNEEGSNSAMQYPVEKESCMRVDVVDSLVEEVFETSHQAKQEEIHDIQEQEENKLEAPEKPSETKKEEVP